jgi:hypothetical protein
MYEKLYFDLYTTLFNMRIALKLRLISLILKSKENLRFPYRLFSQSVRNFSITTGRPL